MKKSRFHVTLPAAVAKEMLAREGVTTLELISETFQNDKLAPQVGKVTILAGNDSGVCDVRTPTVLLSKKDSGIFIESDENSTGE